MRLLADISRADESRKYARAAYAVIIQGPELGTDFLSRTFLGGEIKDGEGESDAICREAPGVIAASCVRFGCVREHFQGSLTADNIYCFAAADGNLISTRPQAPRDRAAAAPLSGLSLRYASPDDAEAVAGIYAPYVDGTAVTFELVPPSVSEMKERIGRICAEYPYIVCLSNGRICGYAYASSHAQREAYRFSVNLSVYVNSSDRGRGIGALMYSALLGELHRRGYHAAFSAIGMPNPESVALHNAAGFEEAGLFRDAGFKLGGWHDVLWLQKLL